MKSISFIKAIQMLPRKKKKKKERKLANDISCGSGCETKMAATRRTKNIYRLTNRVQTEWTACGTGEIGALFKV